MTAEQPIRVLLVDAEGRSELLGLPPGSTRSVQLDHSQTASDAVAKLRAAAAANRPFHVAWLGPTAARRSGDRTSLLAADAGVQLVMLQSDDVAGPAASASPELIEGADRTLFLLNPPGADEARLILASLAARRSTADSIAARIRALEDQTAQSSSSLHREKLERRAAETQLRRLAMHDPLTGLPNRAALLDRLRTCLNRSSTNPGYRFAVLFLDLDNFKVINDGLGHETGDELLIAVAQRLAEAVRRTDSVSAPADSHEMAARLGGDEFIVVLDGFRNDADPVTVARRIMDRVAQPLGAGRHAINVSASIGINIVRGSARGGADARYERPEDVLRDADIAMYRAKGSGKGRYAIFDEHLHYEALERLALENDLRHALDESQFRVVYEPIVQTTANRIAGFEALVRWQHPVRGIVGPSHFIPLAEELGLIVPLGRWILGQATAQLRRWHDQFPQHRDLSISVNLSRRQLIEPGVVDDVRAALRQSGIDPGQLNLEITESAIADRFDVMADTLRSLKDLGVKIHLDDFGTGLSSLSCLHRFPIDVLKIDRSFIMNMTDSVQFAALVHAVLTLARNLRIKVIAEGVESQTQLAQLVSLDCDYIQGYHISQALDGDAAGTLLLSDGEAVRRAA